MKGFVLGVLLTVMVFCFIGCTEDTEAEKKSIYQAGYDDGYESAIARCYDELSKWDSEESIAFLFNDNCMEYLSMTLASDGDVNTVGDWRTIYKGLNEIVPSYLDDIAESDEDYGGYLDSLQNL